MIIVEPTVEKLEQKSTVTDAFRHAEYAGRICYNSIDKMNDAYYNKGFIDGLIANGHYSPLAHGYIYLTIPKNLMGYNITKLVNFLIKDTFFTRTVITPEKYYISTNLRVLYEHFKFEDINIIWPFVGSPTIYHDIYYSFKVQTSIGVTRELNRHAAYLAICEQSTRWCNFSKKDAGEVYFIKPWFYDNNTETSKIWKESCKQSEEAYMKLLEQGNKPDVARNVLNLSTRSVVVYTAPKSKWDHVLSLRSSDLGAKNVHPDCAIIANKINKLINE